MGKNVIFNHHIFHAILFMFLLSKVSYAQNKMTFNIEEDSIKYVLKSAIYILNNTDNFEEGVRSGIKGMTYAKVSDNMYLKGLSCVIDTHIAINNDEILSAKRSITNAIHYFKKVNAKEEYANAYELLGIVYYYLKEKDQSKIAFLEAEKNCKYILDKINAIDIYFNLSNIYLHYKNWDKSIEYANKSLSVIENIGKKQKNKSQLFCFVGQSYSGKGDYDNAKLNFDKALEEPINDRFKALIETNIANFYEKYNDAERAIEFYNRSIESYLNFSHTQILNANSNVDLKKEKITRQLENEKLKAENELKTENIRFNQYLFFSSLVIIIGLIFLVFKQYKGVRYRVNISLMLEEKNKALLKEKKKAEKAGAVKSNFISIINYELKSPLKVINTIAYNLRQKQAQEKQINYVNALIKSSKYLLEFINKVITIDLLKNKKNITLNIGELNLKETINEIVGLVDVSNSKNKIFVEIDNQIPEIIFGDKVKISEILINLLDNANKFTHRGSVIIELKLVKRTKKKTEISFKIKDTGIGIEKEAIAVIFNDFQQASTAINRSYGGIGLGLSIVKELVKFHGAKIKVFSEVGRGTMLSFIIKFDNQEKNKGTIINHSFKILLVEDDYLSQIVTQKRINDMGVFCDIANNGLEAVDLCVQNKYDLVLMDINMPIMNGCEAAKKILAFNKSIPIIALTGISDIEAKFFYERAGIKRVINKKDDLRPILEDVVIELS